MPAPASKLTPERKPFHAYSKFIEAKLAKIAKYNL